MRQSFKNVYFKDHPKVGSARASLTLAFGKKDNTLYEAVRHLSSDAVRNALGCRSFATLQARAQDAGMSINAFCISTLQGYVDANGSSRAEWLPGFEPEVAVALDPIQATFKGGRHEPLHDWYPWLEGYSSAFVESIIERYCPNAKSVFDPFAGTGTTPLTVARLARRAYFCELNPLLQLLIASKILALRLPDDERAMLVAELSALALNLDRRIDSSRKDLALQLTYPATFGESTFFGEDVLSDILRCRTAIDDIKSTAPLTAQFLTIAVLRALIPASRLIRRGDLRFKTIKEMAGHQPQLRDEIRNALYMIANDLKEVAPTEHAPIQILENAKTLDRIPTLGLDAVITSPPYLNGTNYFRNTKLELWFLRCLKGRKDLARLRFTSMTAGINDVTVEKPIGEVPPSVPGVVGKLEELAYDSRIPRMVACFASEMHALLQTFARHVSNGGTIIVDIGDSAYAGIHVPTDKFIAESLATAGFDVSEELVLRQRYSRSQMKLTQKLLVFSSKPDRRKTDGAKSVKNGWSVKWDDFKRTLPHQQGKFAKRNWGHPLHSLCSYQGKMKPSLAAHLVKAFTTPGNRMLDPFCGVGTIPFEAGLNGVASWGLDISPPAVHVTSGKLGRREAKECERTIQRLEDYLNNNNVRSAERNEVASIRFNGVLSSYFHNRTLEEVLLARRYFGLNSPDNPSQSLVLACLLHILHGNRPYALSRRSHPITPFAPTGEAEYRALIPRLRAKLARSLAKPLPPNFVHGNAVYHDATEWWPAEVHELDAIITSPPFYASTRFHLGNWMRLWFCGWQAKDFRERPIAFIDERQKRNFDVYVPVFRQCRERLKTGGVAVFHLGASRKCDMAVELSRIARPWFRVSDVYLESVSHCESHGIRDKGTVVSHQYLVLQ